MRGQTRAIARLSDSVRGRPFSFAVAAFLLGLAALRIPTVRPEFLHGIWFCCGAFVLWGLSQLQDPYPVRTPELGILAVWVICVTFWHNTQIPIGSIVESYANLYPLLAGALYVLCGILIIRLVAEYAEPGPILYGWLALLGIQLIAHVLQPEQSGLLWSKSQAALFYALSVPVCFATVPLFSLGPLLGLGLGQSYSAIFALGLASGVVAAAWGRSWLLGPIAAFFVFLAWWRGPEVLWERLSCRPEAWWLTLQDILKRPLWGHGFPINFMRPMVLTSEGWLYRHNDLLALWRDLGLPAVVAVGLFVRRILSPMSWWSVWVILIMALTMLVQTQASFPRIMGPVCVLLGLICGGFQPSRYLLR